VGDATLNVNFALSKVVIGAAGVLSWIVLIALFASQIRNYYNGISNY